MEGLKQKFIIFSKSILKKKKKLFLISNLFNAELNEVSVDRQRKLGDVEFVCCQRKLGKEEIRGVEISFLVIELKVLCKFGALEFDVFLHYR